jgi:integrase
MPAPFSSSRSKIAFAKKNLADLKREIDGELRQKNFYETWSEPHPEKPDHIASHKTHGKTPRFGGMLVPDCLYPAAEMAGIIFRQQDRSYVDSTGRVVTRFGFHNLRKAVSDYLNEGKKVDVRTIQDTLRHENPEMTLARCTQSSLEYDLPHKMSCWRSCKNVLF